MKSTNTYTPRIVGALAIAIVAGAGGYLFFTSAKSLEKTAVTQSSEVTSVPAATPSKPTTDTTTPTTNIATTSSVYKDGEYTVSKNYSVPEGGVNGLTVTLTISGDKITAVKTATTIQEDESQRYVDSFNKNISSKVVGVILTDAYVGRVGSASLTSSAFNDALDSIMASAKA